jgi:serine/threonine-protein kinase
MGVVYLARDTRLDRDVAIKALPEELAADPVRLERFEREARTLAQLSHPNLAGIYGIEEQDGARYLILEYVEGETIADILDRGPLSVDDALEYAVQIAAGVEAAHEAGVIHRDLKPANIKVTPEGKAKVLDFGLARADEGSTSPSSIGLSNSPTVTTPIQHSPTIPGAILGTAPYMSPEQARGRKVDKRTDIWSFAVVLYEMLTGVGPFHGETATDSIGAILHKDVDLALLPNNTPHTVKRVLTRCLARDKAQRYRDIGDVRIELANAASNPSIDTAPRTSNKLFLPLAALIAVLAGVGGWFLKPAPVPPPPSETFRFTVPLENIGALDNPMNMRISPTGRLVAYTGRTPDDPEDLPPAVCLHDLRTGESRRLAGTENAYFLSFSPSGSQIAFAWFDPDSRREELRRVPTRGGPVLSVYSDRIGTDYNMTTLLWLSETELLAASQEMETWYRVSTTTGAFTELGKFKGLSEFSFGGIVSLIDEQTFCVTLGKLTNDQFYFDSYLCDLSTMEATLLLNDAASVTFVAPGHIVFGRDSTLCTAPFDLITKTITGAITPVLSGLVSPVSFTASRSGDLLTRRGGPDTDRALTWTTREGVSTPVISSTRKFAGSLDVSSDGSRIITNILSDQDTPSPYIIEIATGFVRPLDTNSLISVGEGFTPDDRVIVARVHSPKHLMLEIIDPDGVQDPFVPLPESDNLGVQLAPCFTPDGRYLLLEYQPNEETMEGGIYMVDLEASETERKAIPVVATEADEGSPSISPDGKWMSFHTNASGESQILIRAFDPQHPAARTRTIPISFDGGLHAFWSPDGSELFFLDLDDNLMSAKITNEPAFTIAPPTLVLSKEQLKANTEWSAQIVDIMPDGLRFVCAQNPEEAESNMRIEYVLNWAAELREPTQSGGS